MLYPTVIVDDFFKYPNKIKELSQDLIYEKDNEGRWPGVRSKPLHEVNYDFFNFLHIKIFSILYPNNHERINYSAQTYFQKVSGTRHPHPGWIHSDHPDEFTAIVYLSDHKNCGTSLWKKKSFYITESTSRQKMKYYKNNVFNKEHSDAINKHNSNYNKILTVDSIFNRLLIFDSSQNHSAEGFVDKDIKEDRLTLITFVKKVNLTDCQIKYPIVESNRLE